MTNHFEVSFKTSSTTINNPCRFIFHEITILQCVCLLCIKSPETKVHNIQPVIIKRTYSKTKIHKQCQCVLQYCVVFLCWVFCAFRYNYGRYNYGRHYLCMYYWVGSRACHSLRHEVCMVVYINNLGYAI